MSHVCHSLTTITARIHLSTVQEFCAQPSAVLHRVQSSTLHCTALHGAALMQGSERTHCGRGHSEGATGRIRSRGHVRGESSASENFHPHTSPFTLNPQLIYTSQIFLKSSILLKLHHVKTIQIRSTTSDAASLCGKKCSSSMRNGVVTPSSKDNG